MTQDVIDRFVSELQQAFPVMRTASEGAQTLVRLTTVPLPNGCDPAETDVLVVLTPGAKPELFTKIIPTRPDGGTPRSTGTTTIAGESWCTFSYNLAWDENSHSAEQFVYGRLRRFSRNE